MAERKSISVKIENIPPTLQTEGSFCVWKYEYQGNRLTKVPYNPKTGGRAQSTNPDTFAPLPVAIKALERGNYDGIGVGVFGDLGAADVDHCIDDNGKLSTLALDVMTTMHCYSETSPGGDGLRILFKARDFAYDRDRYYINCPDKKKGFEVYIAGCTQKFVTITGNTLTPGLDLEERGDEIKVLLERYMVKPTQTANKDGPISQQKNTNLSDLQVIEKAKNSTKFALLWDGDWSGYGSHSEGDLALCSMLAWWTGKDSQQIDRLFRASKMIRPKWDTRRGGSTYGKDTIQKAIDLCEGGYDPETYFSQLQSKAGHLSEVKKKSNVLRPPDFSDAGNSEIFCRTYRNKLIYTDSRGWLVWNGKVWEANDHRVHQLAVDLSASMLDEAQREYREALHRKADAEATKAEGGEVENEEKIKKAVKDGKDYLNHAQQLRSERRIKAMLELSRHELAVDPSILDANPAELNTPTGIIDLTTGNIRPNDPTAYCTKITSCGPGTQGAEMWIDFLDTISEGDDKLTGYLQLTAGMALYGKVYEEGLILAYGGGRNGKSTYYNAQAAVMGDYAGEISIETLTTDRQDRGPALVELRGKRLVLAGELEEGKRLSVSTVKKITSTDRITAAAKYRQPETFTPSHTLVLHSNYLPRVGSNDDGTWRRLHPVEFKAKIPEGKGISNYADNLVADAGPAILTWCIMGAMDFARNGYRLTTPDVVAIAAEEYRRREDWLENFLSESCVLEPVARAPAGELYQTYRQWAEDVGDFVRRLTDFNMALAGRGFIKRNTHGNKVWIGLRIDKKARFTA